MRWLWLLLSAVSCGGGGGDGAQRLTSSADPVAPRINLTQWNWNRQLAVDDSGALHVVWAQLGTLNINLPADRADPVDPTTLPLGQLMYLRSSDGGATWSSETPLGARAAGVDSASVAVAGGVVYVAWRAPAGGRLGIFAQRSRDGGVSWDAPTLVSDNPAGVGVSAPALAATADALYLVWPDARPQLVAGQTVRVKEVYLAVSRDGGASWSAAQPVSTPDGFSSWTPAVAASATGLHVAWTDERDDLGECTRGANSCHEEEYYRRSLDGGASWGAETRLTFDPPGAPKESWAPSLAVAGNTVHVAYLDKRSGFFQVYYQRSTDGGATFGGETRVQADAAFANAARPTIAAIGDDVGLAWFGFTDFEADVYLARSRDGGASWSPYANLTADAPGAARLPHVALAPDRAAHVVWYDTRASDAAGPRIELFYRRVAP